LFFSLNVLVVVGVLILALSHSGRPTTVSKRAAHKQEGKFGWKLKRVNTKKEIAQVFHRRATQNRAKTLANAKNTKSNKIKLKENKPIDVIWGKGTRKTKKKRKAEKRFRFFALLCVTNIRVRVLCVFFKIPQKKNSFSFVLVCVII
jgi:hypothetical protein